MSNLSGYKIPAVEKSINKIIGFVFWYRLPFVFAALLTLLYLTYRVYNSTADPNKFLNSSAVLTGGSIIIGIFYSIINYENAHLKFKHDIKTARELLTFTTATKMHEHAMIDNFRTVKNFYNDNKQFFIHNRMDEIERLLNATPDIRKSYLAMFNYLECIAIGVNQGIMDEVFVKEFFRGMFFEYTSYYGPYLEYVRKEKKNAKIYVQVTMLANKWAKEN